MLLLQDKMLFASDDVVVLQFIKLFWNESGELLCIATEDSFYILKYNVESFEKSKENPELVTEDGIEEAFEVIDDNEE